MIASKPHPSKLYVETTTLCNLNCEMCVKYADGACIREQSMSMDVFRALAPAFPHLDGLILNGIGEPLLAPHLLEMISLARQTMRPDALISFQSNGMLLTPALAEDLVRAGLDKICLSVDMVGREGVFHGGEDISDTVHAFEYLQDAARKVGRPLSIGVEFVLMRDNAEALPRSLEWAADQGADFGLVTHMLPYAEDMADQELFNPNTDRSMLEFERWRQEAEDLGMNLSAYFGTSWKFRKTNEDLRLMRFVNERRMEAFSRDIPIHIVSLEEWSTPDKLAEQQWLEALLAEARSVAEARGMDVALPPVAATHERKCDFMEQGVVHITPTGDARPCYFLWHEYSCFMDKGLKKVSPVTFGNVTEDSILDIWNSEDYVAFRTEALRYDFPYCSNCSVVPCSDVTGAMGVFQQDCYGLNIPCGHCHWCMGGLRCLL
ncbi:radical SAM/SPASM family putative metalloenzyme maturase [Pseudodesulfovibrio cashew]|uniref:Radical SAM/SPASM family putative metalloenzyme maturase n=1 Tax=Pseudodesulfovibrio cashew TaxID=2678688 RepID=A0A6I6JHL2_9BACT|nr:radical SAM/SPASM family putative metalloenzyme maturase [Pseudodesulfovibrio cashew]QGY40498.1 radical SAM/SPASM family putative metalloenzyme maturase [Pseudodesulfovibrio cashew]